MKESQGELFKERGMALVLEHTLEEWKASFRSEGERIAATGVAFTAEDILERVPMPPGHRNAIGAAMNSLIKRLRLVRVGITKAERSSRHAGMVSQWRITLSPKCDV